MKISVVGLNYKKAPINVRERLSFDASDTVKVLQQLKNKFSEAEFVLLSTCNRVELYYAGRRVGGPEEQDLAGFLSEFKNQPLEDIQDFLYIYKDEEAVMHLLKVISSLDSMVVGEAQISKQVKESYRLACSARSTGNILNRLFHHAFATCKKIHTNTSIMNGRTSIAGIAVELAKQLFADMSAAEVLVIGAGETGELLVQHLLHEECKNITIVNRSFERALEMAKRYGVEARKWDELEDELIGANIAISAAAAENFLFDKNSFKRIMDRRKGSALLIIDIGVPRNFESGVNEIEDVYLYSIDDLSKVAEQNRKAREADIAGGMQIIYKDVADFMDWFDARDIGPLIGQMKEKFVQITQNELAGFFAGEMENASCKNMLETIVNRIVNKLLHCMIKNVNIVAKEYGATEAAKLVDSILKNAEEILSKPADKEDKKSEKDHIAK